MFFKKTYWSHFGIDIKKRKPQKKKLLRVVNVPERLSGKSFNFSKIARLFHADCKIWVHICFLINSTSLETSFRIAELHGDNVSPGNCFMSREDFRKNITLKDRPKDFHLLRHQTMNQVLPEYCLLFIKLPVKIYDDILSRNEILYSSLCKNLCYNYY